MAEVCQEEEEEGRGVEVSIRSAHSPPGWRLVALENKHREHFSGHGKLKTDFFFQPGDL